MSDSLQRRKLRQVKRFDPEAKEILASALFVAVYVYDEDGQEWEREDIEGPLFLVGREGEPKHALVVVNRSSSKNLVQPVSDDTEFDFSESYVMFRCDTGVYSLWFNSKDEHEQVKEALENITKGDQQQEHHQQEAMPELLKDMFQQAAAETKTTEETSNGDASSTPQKVPASFSGANAAGDFELSKEQMKDVLLRLVQTDKFIDILHNQYLRTRAAASGGQPSAGSSIANRASPQHAPQHPPSFLQHPHQHQQHGDRGVHHGHGHPGQMAPLAPSPLRQPGYGMQPMYGQPMMYPHHPQQHAPHFSMGHSPPPNPNMPHPGMNQVGARMTPPPHPQQQQQQQQQQHPHQQ
mmetsp:Transcript_13905/g.27009  ORF Transcript_13905/g.27009 Transcript_13905/m.27009 type:complete len:351 (+) Transcript_13905:78-1130(+)